MTTQHRLQPAVAALFLLSLPSCGSPDRQESPTPGQPVQPRTAPSMTEAESSELRAAYESMAPERWVLYDFSRGSAQYRVTIDPVRPRAASADIIGVLSLDGANEPMVKLGRAVPQWTNSNAQQVARASERYSDYEGYRKNVSADTYGYDTNAGSDIRMIEYFDLKKQISCYGYTPGQFRCYWGSRSKRFELFFHSDDIGMTLPYVQNLARLER